MSTTADLASFEQVIRDTKPSRALLMCYCADLAYVESVLLNALGDGAVTFLTDRSSYHESFSDLHSVCGPGLRYALYPLRLPGDHAAFHPKLYCLDSPSGITLVVASANLTFFGARSNAEVVDVLRLTTATAEAKTAFQGYAELLTILPALDPTLPAHARDTLASLVDRISELARVPRASAPSDPALLHSGSTSLLSQLQELVPAAKISAIDFFSPFYDFKSAALLSLARAYPDARLTLVKRPGGDDFNGDAAAALKKRLKVLEFLKLDGRRRTLHAKIMLLRGKSSAWLVTGSANLTAPAWLKSAKDGGNLEAVVVRRISTAEARRWWNGVKTRAVTWDTMTYARHDEDDRRSSAEIEIVDAEPQGRALQLHCRADGWERSAVSSIVTVESRRKRHAAVGRIIVGDPVVVDGDTGDADLDDVEGPIAVRLDVVSSDGERRTGNAWLHRSDLLGMPAEVRRLYRAREVALNRLAGTGDDWERLAEGFAAFVQQMYDPRGPRAAAAQGRPAGSPLNETAVLRSEDLFVAESEVRLHSGSSHPAVRELFESILRSVQGLFRDAPSGLRRPHLPSSAPESDVGSDETDDEEALAEDEVQAARRAPLGEESVRKILAPLSDMWATITSSDPTDEHVEGALKVLEITVAGFLHRLFLRLTDTEGDERAEVIGAAHRLWAQLLSVDGVAEGFAAGWLVRAWAHPSSRAATRALVGPRDRLGRLLALLSLSLKLGQEHGTTGSQTGVIAGLQVLMGGTWPDSNDEAYAAAAEAADNLASLFPGAATTNPIEALRAFAKDLGDYPIVSAARRWAVLVRLMLADDGGRDVGPLERAVSAVSSSLLSAYRRSRRRYRPAAVPVVLLDDSLVCGGCHLAIPRYLLDRIRDLEVTPTSCESCGRLLLPFDFQQASLRAVLEVIAPDLRFGEAAA